MIIAYSFGILDLLNYGHIRTLKKAKENSDLHIFGLISDESAIEWMGVVLSDFKKRLEVVEQLSSIDEIMYQKSLDPINNLKKIHEKHPKAEIHLYHGDNWKIMPAQDYIESIGGKTIFTEYYKPLSPNEILGKLNKRKDLIKVNSNIISTKASTLNALKKFLKKSVIEDILIIKVQNYLNSTQETLQHISRKFNGERIVIRSSSSNEDSLETSNAGHYHSVLNIDSNNLNSVESSINEVVLSYKNDGLELHQQQVLIQSQTNDVVLSGVVFTRDIKNNRPYYVINYDDNGSTDSVTSGQSGKTVYISRNSSKALDVWSGLIESVLEIEEVLKGMILDIEFAITKKNQVIIFQVRPLAANYRFVNDEEYDKVYFEKLDDLSHQYKSLVSRNQKLDWLSDMAFWNPSEIIGDNPRNLDYSLYREIITKSTWNQGLVNLGYQEVNQELMYKIGNKPYISIVYSFMSLIPSSLSPQLSTKLVEYYKHKLKKDLSAHDKIEFEIVLSCFDLNTDDRLKELKPFGFDDSEILEIKQSLVDLTQSSITHFDKTLLSDGVALRKLESITKNIEDNFNTERDLIKLIDDLLLLIDSIKKYGTPQFSRQARFALISKAILNSFVDQDLISQHHLDVLLNQIETIATEFDRDFKHLLNGELSLKKFNDTYGHLRSGSYDIRTPRYKDINLLNKNSHSHKISNIRNRDKSKQEPIFNNTINHYSEILGINIHSKKIQLFLTESIKQREYFKYEFTKSLSLALEMIKKIGNFFDFNIDELSHLNFSDIIALKSYDSLTNKHEFWLEIIKARRETHEKFSGIVMPEIILKSQDLSIIKFEESRPNFITEKIEIGEIINLEASLEQDIQGKIIIITKADPGFDWIFTKNIKGLITKYGGVASHIAIRCAEFGTPAAIGCGEKIYEFVVNQNHIKLDCKNQKILPIAGLL